MDKLGHFCVHLVEVCFFGGLLGSVFVVLLSAVDDARTLFSQDEPAAPHTPAA